MNTNKYISPYCVSTNDHDDCQGPVSVSYMTSHCRISQSIEAVLFFYLELPDLSEI